MLQLLGFIIDCPDPMKLAAFYSQVTGRAIMEGSSGSFAGITFGEVDLAFQRVADYRPPRWPDDEHPKQYHLDFEVDEIEPEQRTDSAPAVRGARRCRGSTGSPPRRSCMNGCPRAGW
jgi:hypothetical protein